MVASRSPLSGAIELPDTTQFATVGDTEVPWRCGSLEDDYSRIRQSAALIDLTGAGLIAVTGPDAQDLVERLVTREVGYMTADRTIMGMVLREDGRPLDVVTLFRTDDGFLLQTSVGTGGSVLAALQAHATDGTEVADLASSFAIVAIEGPDATAAVSGVLEEPVDGLPFQGSRTTAWKGGDLVVSRTGVTGEFGFTFLVPDDQVSEFWRTLSTVATPCGIEALESAMLEIRQPVVLREVLDDDTVITAGFNWLVDIEKEDFIGRDAVVAAFDAATPTRRASIVAAEEVARGDRVTLDGEDVGDVVHAAYSPSLQSFVGVARLASEFTASGLSVGIGSTSGRTATPPVVTPTSWRALQA